jgi:hypothetical protein
MEKQELYTYTYYKCPKCDYKSSKEGVCPRDGTELKLVVERKDY